MKKMKYIISIALMLFAIETAFSQSRDAYHIHTVKSGETLYSISKHYEVSLEELLELNPSCRTRFVVGYELKVPMKKKNDDDLIYYTIKEGDTLYRIAIEHGLSVKELLEYNRDLSADNYKVGHVIKIPKKRVEKGIEHKAEKKQEDRSFFDLFTERNNGINISLALPFTSESKCREFYEGFLIALDTLKKSGVSVNLSVYDSGRDESDLKRILDEEISEDCDLVFAPFSNSHIGVVSEYARENRKNVVIPFSQKVLEVDENPYLYQVNTLQSELFPKIYEVFLERYPNCRPVFIDNLSDSKSKPEFIEMFKENLRRDKIGYAVIKDSINEETIVNALDQSKNNVFIPTSSSSEILKRNLHTIISSLREKPEYSASLFGYPEWQIYSKDLVSLFYEISTTFYSTFYFNESYKSSSDFILKYLKWYRKDIQSKYPNMAMLGYDTAYFFIKALETDRNNLRNGIRNTHTSTIQNALGFVRASEYGGMKNNKLFFIEFNKDLQIIRSEH